MPVHATIPAWHGSIDDEIGSRVPCRAIYRPRCHASPACTQDHHPPPLWITLGPDLSLHATTCVSSVRRLRACTHEITRPTYARPWSIDRYTPPRETPSRCAIKRSRHPHPSSEIRFFFLSRGSRFRNSGSLTEHFLREKGEISFSGWIFVVAF